MAQFEEYLKTQRGLDQQRITDEIVGISEKETVS